MKSRIVVLSMGGMLFLACNVFSAEQKGSMMEHKSSMMEHKDSMMEHKGSMMEHKGSMVEHHEEEEMGDTIEVGNKICPVSKRPVDVMGGHLKYKYKGKIYNLCCKICLKSFKKNPEKYRKVVEEMMDQEHDEDGGHDH